MNDYLNQSRKLTDDGYARKWHLEGTIHNIHGAYAKRVIKKETKRKSGRKKKKRSEEEEGVQAAVLDTTKTEDTVDTMTDEIEIHAFPHDKDGYPQIPLGGPRGYIAGALRASARSFGAQRGQKFFGVLSHITRGGIVITPDWVTLKSKEEPDPMVHITVLNPGRTALPFYFDYVKKSPFTIEMYESATWKKTTTKKGKKAKDQTQEQPFTSHIMDKDHFLMLIGKIESTPIGPKGRGSIEWTKIEQLK